jgi:ADP-heptose:LPS heptosyltransferase
MSLKRCPGRKRVLRRAGTWNADHVIRNDALEDIFLIAETDRGVEQKIHFVSLQHPAVEAVAGTPAANVSRYYPGIKDFAETAACIEQLDAVVAVDSVVSNLSAMMGKHTVVLTHTSGDWRWGTRGASTPWLHNVTVLRQKLAGDWSTVAEEAIAWLTG